MGERWKLTAGLRRCGLGSARRSPDATDPVDGSRLPGELRPLIEALNGLLERMRLAIQRERSFTNDAAHELRTPLTVIDTHLQVARLNSGGAAEEALADAATGVERMHGTLEQLLMLARIEGRLPFDEGVHVTAGEAVSRAIAVAGSDAAARTTVEGDGGVEFLGVPPELAVVALRNLIGNAVRYSPEASPVEVSIESCPGHVLRFVVADHGSGLGSEEAEAATRRFWRGDASRPGSGLGLTLVDAIAKRFDGSLVLRARSPHGLAAELRLPVHQADGGP